MVLNKPNSFFRPGVFVLNKLKYVYKFIFISFFVVLPLTVAFFYILLSARDNINFIKRELIGIEYLKETSKLINDIQIHRDMVTMHYSNQDNFGLTAYHQFEEIKEALNRIDVINDKYGKDIGVFEEWKLIRKEWKSDVFVLSSKSYEDYTKNRQVHREYLNKLMLFNLSVADGSNLMLDPQITTYYLMSLIVLDIPFFQEDRSRIMSLVLSLAPDFSASEFNNQSSNMALSSLGFLFSKVDRSFNIILNNEIDSHEYFSDSIIALKEGLNSDLNLVDSISTDGHATISANSLYISIQKNNQNIDTIYSLLIARLETLLNNRLNSVIFYRNSTMLVIFLLIVTYAYFYACFYFSFFGIIASLRDLSQRIINKETMADNIVLDSHDEMGDIVKSFNNLFSALSKSNIELERQLSEEKILQEKLTEQKEELEKFNKLMVGRELKMAELKEQLEKAK